ncbi:MAG: glycosyltransferase family 4 protein [Treponema sp.]|jgi:glycosyltransferase involved in cell wall biosynthesis|nr:glycosyltransferase family 4 protein [Treponema sp.]
MSVYVYTNGVQCLPEISLQYDKRKIVFIGNMRTLQNQDSVQFFINSVFPIVKKSISEAIFYVLGADPPQTIKDMSDGKNIVVSGFVNSIENEIKNSAVAVAPVRIAAGIQNKVLISMACGIPVVLTSIIASAIPGLKSGQNCLIADTEQDFAAAVIFLAKDSERRNTIAESGYRLMQTSYSWNKCLEGYEL